MFTAKTNEISPTNGKSTLRKTPMGSGDPIRQPVKTMLKNLTRDFSEKNFTGSEIDEDGHLLLRSPSS